MDKLVSQIRGYPYTGKNRVRDDTVEYARLPSIAAVFYKCIFNMDMIPTESVLIDQYFKAYFNEVLNGEYLVLKYQYRDMIVFFKRPSLEARILRAYPSLIRDFHFYLLCSESGHFDEVSYSLRDDCIMGVDINIVKDNTMYGVSLNTATPRSKQFKEKKYSRHDYSQIKEIHLEIELNFGNKVGPFILYTDKDLAKLLSKIKEE